MLDEPNKLALTPLPDWPDKKLDLASAALLVALVVVAVEPKRFTLFDSAVLLLLDWPNRKGEGCGSGGLADTLLFEFVLLLAVLELLKNEMLF